MANKGVGGLGFSGGLSIATGGGAVTITPVNQTPSVLDISGVAGNTMANWRSFVFVVKQGTIDIDGVTFPVGTYGYDNDTFGILAAIAYDATASTDATILIQN